MLTALELSNELAKLANIEKEFKVSCALHRGCSARSSTSRRGAFCSLLPNQFCPVDLKSQGIGSVVQILQDTGWREVDTETREERKRRAGGREGVL